MKSMKIYDERVVVGENCNMSQGRDRCNSNNSSGSSSNNSDQSRVLDRRTEKYGLRPRVAVRRLQQDKYKDNLVIKRESKCSKSRPPPLSKYRRKTANARERHRMKEINDAFETLRRILPDFCSSQAAEATTKINTLRLAVRYIRALSHLLQEEGPSISLLGDLHLEQVTPHAMSQSGSDKVPEGNQYTNYLEASPSDETPSFISGGFTVSSGRGTTSKPFITPPSHQSSSSMGSSLGSGSDFSEFLSDGSCCVFENTFDFFDDIPVLSEVDSIAVLLTAESESQVSM